MYKKILISMILIVFLILVFSESVVAEKVESFTWDRREELIVITAGKGVEGFNKFVVGLDKVLPGISGWRRESILDFTTNERDLKKMRDNHIIFIIRPRDIKEFKRLEAKHADLVPITYSELKSYSFPLLYFSRDDEGKIRGVIIVDEVTLSLAELLTKQELLLNTPFWYENGQLKEIEEK